MFLVETLQGNSGNKNDSSSDSASKRSSSPIGSAFSTPEILLGLIYLFPASQTDMRDQNYLCNDSDKRY